MPPGSTLSSTLKTRTLALLVGAFLAVWPASKAFAEEAIVPSPPDISSENYILVDALTGKVLSGRNIDAHVEPASITKLMTAYIAYKTLRSGQISLQDEVIVSEKAWRTGGSRMFIDVNKPVTVEELIKGVAIQSGNDASVALAEFIAGTEEAFAQMMNAEAERLGMHNTHFTNSTGWPHPEQHMSAADIAILTRALINEFPAHYKAYSEKQYTYNGITQYNRNRLLWRDPSVDGVKTGFTETAGYCLVSSAERKGMRLITVVLGMKNDAQRVAQSITLLNFGFRFYTTKLLLRQYEPLEQVRVWGSRDKFTAFGPARDLYVTVPKGGEKRLEVTHRLADELKAPLAKGLEIGELTARYNDQFSYQVPLVVLNDTPQGNWMRRIVDAVIRLF